MPLTRDQARQTLKAYVDVIPVPTLSDGEIESCLDRAQCVDWAGIAPGVSGWDETVWAQQALVFALELLVGHATHLVDFTADGTTISQSQARENIVTMLRSARAGLLWGTP